LAASGAVTYSPSQKNTDAPTQVSRAAARPVQNAGPHSTMSGSPLEAAVCALVLQAERGEIDWLWAIDELVALVRMLAPTLSEAFGVIARFGRALPLDKTPLDWHCEWLSRLRKLPLISIGDTGATHSAERTIAAARPYLERMTDAGADADPGDAIVASAVCSLLPRWAKQLPTGGVHWQMQLRVVADNLCAVVRCSTSSICSIAALSGMVAVALHWAVSTRAALRGLPPAPVATIVFDVLLDAFEWHEEPPFPAAIAAKGVDEQSRPEDAYDARGAAEKGLVPRENDWRDELGCAATSAERKCEAARLLALSGALGIAQLLQHGVLPPQLSARFLCILADSTHQAARGGNGYARLVVPVLAGLAGPPWRHVLTLNPAGATSLLSALVACIPSDAATRHGEGAVAAELQIVATHLLDQFISTTQARVARTEGVPSAIDANGHPLWARVLGREALLSLCDAHAVGHQPPMVLSSADESLPVLAAACQAYRHAHALPPLSNLLPAPALP
jgi:hypothetical protein